MVYHASLKLSKVRQHMLSQSLFNRFINKLIIALKLNEFGCHFNKRYTGCMFCADHIILIYASVAGLPSMLDIFDLSVGLAFLQLIFIGTKCFCICSGPRHKMKVVPMKRGNDDSFRTDFIKHLGVTLRAGVKLYSVVILM
jgi:hypothetical protein